MVAKVTDQLDAEGIAYEIYLRHQGQPDHRERPGGRRGLQGRRSADYIIAIGGGSPMDTAKAIGIIINNPEFADVRSLEGVAPTKKPCVPIIAVPDHRRHRRRGHDQLRHHGRGAPPQVRLR